MKQNRATVVIYLYIYTVLVKKIRTLDHFDVSPCVHLQRGHSFYLQSSRTLCHNKILASYEKNNFLSYETITHKYKNYNSILRFYLIISENTIMEHIEEKIRLNYRQR